MISHQHQCLFIHIPKAAGQSVEQAILNDMDVAWEARAPYLLRPNRDIQKGPPRLAHLTAEEYVQLGYVNLQQFNAYFTFSFVRNPWSRLVSEYTYRRALNVPSYQCDFKTWVLARFPIPKDDQHANGLDLYRHILPQSKFLFDSQGQCLVDFVGRFESINEDFKTVALKLNLKTHSLPFKNSTQTLQKRGLWDKLNRLFAKQPTRPHYSQFYDAETHDFVRQFYHSDLMNFGYQFDNQAGIDLSYLNHK